MTYEEINMIITNYVGSFANDLKNILKKLGITDIEFDNPNLANISISIDESNSQSQVCNYNQNENIIFINKNSLNAPNLRYFLNKSLLECTTTKKTDKGILQGVAIITKNGNFNYSLNNAITENILNLMMCDDGEEIGKYITERKNLAKLEKIVGSETIIKTYFNNDYVELEEKFNFFTNEENTFKNLVDLMDNLTAVNHDNRKITTSDDMLAFKIDRILINTFIKKSLYNKESLIDSNFQEFIITKNGVRGEFGFSDKIGYKNVDQNLDYYNNFKKQFKNIKNFSEEHTQSL